MQTPSGSVRWRHSLRTRIALWFGGITLLLLLLVGTAVGFVLRREIIEEARLDVRATALEAAGRLDNTLREVAITTHGLADLVAVATLDNQHRLVALQSMVRATPGASGGLLALEPDARGRLFAHYFSLEGRSRDFVADDYDYRAKSWYRRTATADGGWWSEPYENRTAGGVWMATYNVPVSRPPGGAHRGMVSADVALDRLVATVESLAYLPGWRTTLVAPGGTVALSSEPGAVPRRPLARWIESNGRGDLQQALAAMREHRGAHFEHVDARSGEQLFSVVEPIGDSGWSLLVTQSDALVVRQLNRALLLLLGAVALLLALATWLVRMLARQITRPVEALASSAARLGRGDYGRPVAHTGRADEVGQLARTLEHARTSIQRQLAEIEEMGAARQKLESELSIARDIQRALLPGGRQVVVDGHGRLDAQASLEPAKSVGGDFYNFIERGSGELWFVIGDVSDKGVPAALFMARALTLLEVATHGADSPEQALVEASRRLVDGNDTCMFATVLCGRIDAGSGDCLLASAAHDPPLLLRADGQVELLALDTGPPLGIDPCEQFPTLRLQLQPGDCLLAYTDGVTEAFNPDNEAYGSERLLAVVRPGDSALGHCHRLIAEVHRFAQDAPQSDDITVLAIRMDRAAAPQATT